MNDELLDLLAIIFEAYEEGTECYEDPEDCAGYLGHAVLLDTEVFNRVAEILNEHRPVVGQSTKYQANLPYEEKCVIACAGLPDGA